MVAFLQTLLTVSGITLGIIFMFLVDKHFEARRDFAETLKALKASERKLLRFLELCDESVNSSELWHDMPRQLPDEYDHVWDSEGYKKHEFPGAVALYTAIGLLAREWLNCSRATLFTAELRGWAPDHAYSSTLWLSRSRSGGEGAASSRPGRPRGGLGEGAFPSRMTARTA